MNKDQENIAMALLTRYLTTRTEADLFEFRKVYTQTIPSWHLIMLNDGPRNDFYRAEINEKVKDKIVLDIGCGSGLLTFYALEAGAKHVYSVERDPILQTCFAFAFKTEIEQGRVTLFRDLSSKLELSDFKVGTPEVVVHEIFSNDLFSEHVMEAFDDLFKRGIVDAGMEFIPQKFRLMGCLHLAQGDDDVVELEDLEIRKKFWFLEDLAVFGKTKRFLSHGDKRGNDISDEIEIFNVDMKIFATELDHDVTIESRSEGNFLRTWFELNGDCGNLNTNIKEELGSHWENTLYPCTVEKQTYKVSFRYAQSDLSFYMLKTF